ncbi:ABC transporter substrate-binding protein [Phototrophicus methaneseepsis]|uniref:ABC transporter substrate-binding protein n=1 Tax=Phototrophicus methaneseepsis TaxID=2710758 RepID=A0A7S8E5C2_9CHLR|nr:ABC transporter substrate-binding protein [Phototrophicus methaneseepsis]QPC80645.1 ABC transporter substrate-binding protein [Phototrophicus methaneseepsis]
MKKLLSLVLTLSILFGAFSFVSAQDNTLIMARAVDATGLDPHTQTAFASLRLLELVYEPLVTTDQDLNLIPVLATDWSFSDDGMALTFNLREGVTFHDGSDFTAEDVIASFERILDEETGSAAASNYASIESMEAPDDYTVVFNLSTPDVPILSAMASTNAAILSSDVIANEDPSLVTVGTGPFMLESWTPDEVTNLAANPDWWGEGPFVDGIEIRIIPDEASILAALRAGTIDFALLSDPLIATLLIDSPDIVLNRTPSLSYNVLQLRAAVEPLDQLEVRQAISCAIDRQQVVDTAALGEGKVTGPLTMASYALPLEDLFCYEQDLDMARELMAQAGMEEGFTLNVIVANAEPPVATSIAQNLQSQLEAINISVEIEAMELATYVDRWLAGDFMAAVALNGGRVDPYTMYSRYWQEGANFQETAGYLDDTLDTLMKEGQVETDPDARYEIFAEFQQHLAETSPWVWLYAGYTYTAQQPYVTGWTPTASDSLYFLSAVQVDK